MPKRRDIQVTSDWRMRQLPDDYKAGHEQHLDAENKRPEPDFDDEPGMFGA